MGTSSVSWNHLNLLVEVQSPGFPMYCDLSTAFLVLWTDMSKTVLLAKLHERVTDVHISLREQWSSLQN